MIQFSELRETGSDYCEIAVTKPKIKSTSKQTKINITSSINQIVIRYGGKYHRVAVW